MSNYRTINVKPETKELFNQKREEYFKALGVRPTDDEFLTILMNLVKK